ncbi:MAG: hypothetical protein HQK96_17580 [Nitrospirae bacterium]|nr:hypothetical protein [Nitrospirota bacterium]
MEDMDMSQFNAKLEEILKSIDELNSKLEELVKAGEEMDAQFFEEILSFLHREILTPLINLSLENIDKDREEFLRCTQSCIDKHTLSWPNVISSFDLINPLLNRYVGLTRPALGSHSHPTSWQHYWQHNVGKFKFPRLKPWLDPLAKYTGRLAILTTLAEGDWDIAVMNYCDAICRPDVTLSGEPCNSSTDDSCSKLPDIYGK